MNIFVLHSDPIKAAQMMCDKHIVKMILESNQMLSTVARKHGYNAPYRSTHGNHPCTLWAGESNANWYWLIRHSRALCEEYTARYGRTHKSQAVPEWAETLQIVLEIVYETYHRIVERLFIKREYLGVLWRTTFLRRER